MVAACVQRFNIGDYFEKSRVQRGTSRHALFAMAAAKLALADANLDVADLDGESTAVVVGSSLLDFGSIGNAIDAVTKRGAKGANARVVYSAAGTSTSSAINYALRTNARAMTVQSSCCSGLDAIGQAANLIASGAVDIAICGGTEAPLHRFPLLELRAAELTPLTNEMPGRLSRPFDLWRTTGVVSEGACLFILEPEDSPRPGYSFVAGYAFASDADDVLCGGLVESGRLAVADAGVRPEQIESLNTWGPGHKLVDVGEAVAMKKLFGSALTSLSAVSIKGAIGTPLGAAPAIQVAAAALAQRNGVIPPTVNWDYPDPSCPLNLSNRPRSIACGWTLINAHGVGAVNSSMVLQRC
jgi:3-oxoacyl-(acyl-carrier-protein) synthase